jgi:hypothetical protein
MKLLVFVVKTALNILAFCPSEIRMCARPFAQVQAAFYNRFPSWAHCKYNV